VLIAYYAATIAEFQGADPNAILGELARHHRHALEAEQRFAWIRQVELLKAQIPAGLPGMRRHCPSSLPSTVSSP